MRIRLMIGLFTLAVLVGCFLTDSNDKTDNAILPDDFSSACYWSQNSPVQDECARTDESCIESHYLEAGSRSGLGYKCLEENVSSEEKISSSQLVSSSSQLPSSSKIIVSTFTDSRDHNTALVGIQTQDYKTVQIGDQTWMAENLNYDAGEGSYCYDNDASNCDTYGRLYEWIVAMGGAASSDAEPSGVQGVCPDGWHLPSDGEWDVLLNYVIANSLATSNSDAGKYLKANSSLWNTNQGTNEFGFSALPGGYYSDGSFYYQGINGLWWSSTEISSYNSYYRSLLYRDDDFDRSNYNKSSAFSVRCLKN